LTLKEKLNFYGSLKEPFFFMISYDTKEHEVIALKELEAYDIEYEMNQPQAFLHAKSKVSIQKYPLSFDNYLKKFKKVQEHIKAGNSYLLNLTAKSKIKSPLSLKEIYAQAKASFKLRYKDEFVCFSPERFVQISNNTISTYPMKGTIDASVKNAKEQILSNEKEMAEHVMVVDLLRNDLSIVSKQVKVKRFRYAQNINAGNKTLLQISSHIQGTLKNNWHEHIGDIILPMLPAGSITGTPKKSSVQIIEEVEQYKRGYYTGIFGIYDGKSLDSAVMIRFIQKEKEELFYKSGGGITSDSKASAEYQELIDKIYIPV
jgi:para-aminobenzoate synthetase component 1